MRPEKTRASPAPTVAASPGRIDIDSADWPLVRVVYHGDVALDVLRKAAQQYAELAEHACSQNQRLGWLVNLDAFEAHPIDAVKRRGAAEILAEYAPRIARGTFAEARVVESRVIRGVMTAVTWIVRQPWPIQVFGTVQEAEAWLRERAATAKHS